MQIGIVGAGAMGAGIAQVAATAGCEVVVFDNHRSALLKASDNIQASLNRMVEKGRFDDRTAKGIWGNIRFVSNMVSFQHCKLVVEAVVEILEEKQEVFRELEAITAPDCILATNTSSLSVASIAAGCKSPQRVLGLHFFNPAPVMDLVEIIPAIQTSLAYVDQARRWMDLWGKISVMAKDTPGFIVNRIARPFYGEALRIFDEGIATPATIDWAMVQLGGFRMGPFELMDFIGHDVNYRVTESVFTACYFDPRYRPSHSQKRLLEAGYLGRKSGKGFYEYGPGASKPEPDRNESRGQAIVDRILAMLINEAADALQYGIAGAEDIDMAMTKGVNYPKGLLHWADEKGLDWCVGQIDTLHETYHEDRYRCSALLRQKQKSGSRFFEAG